MSTDEPTIKMSGGASITFKDYGGEPFVSSGPNLAWRDEVAAWTGRWEQDLQQALLGPLINHVFAISLDLGSDSAVKPKQMSFSEWQEYSARVLEESAIRRS